LQKHECIVNVFYSRPGGLAINAQLSDYFG